MTQTEKVSHQKSYSKTGQNQASCVSGSILNQHLIFQLNYTKIKIIIEICSNLTIKAAEQHENLLMYTYFQI